MMLSLLYPCRFIVGKLLRGWIGKLLKGWISAAGIHLQQQHLLYTGVHAL